MSKEYNTPHTPNDPEYSLGGRTHTAVEDTGNWKAYINNMVIRTTAVPGVGISL